MIFDTIKKLTFSFDIIKRHWRQVDEDLVHDVRRYHRDRCTRIQWDIKRKKIDPHRSPWRPRYVQLCMLLGYPSFFFKIIVMRHCARGLKKCQFCFRRHLRPVHWHERYDHCRDHSLDRCARGEVLWKIAQRRTSWEGHRWCGGWCKIRTYKSFKIL